MDCQYCNRCQLTSEEAVLGEIASSERRSLQDITGQARQLKKTPIESASSKYRDERLTEGEKKLEAYEIELKQMEEDVSYEAMDSILRGEKLEEIAERMLMDEKRKKLTEDIIELKWQPQEITEKDVRKALEEYERQGFIEIKQGKLKITSRGARILALRALERIVLNLSRRELGTRSTEKPGFGSELSLYTRAYEVGDDYSLINIENTLLNALRRRGTLKLTPEDFEIHEEIHETKLCAGLIIDESSSMKSGGKLGAAIETALALSALITKEPQETLKVFVFSETVKEIPPWAIANETSKGGATDIKAAMRAFRLAVRNEKGDRQAYLITDTDPNTEEGRYTGFESAVKGVIDEALRYRKEGVGLNIIMLDETPKLRMLASTMARKNLGRVFFTSPDKLGQVVMEDYLRARRR